MRKRNLPSILTTAIEQGRGCVRIEVTETWSEHDGGQLRQLIVEYGFRLFRDSVPWSVEETVLLNSRSLYGSGGEEIAVKQS